MKEDFIKKLAFLALYGGSFDIATAITIAIYFPRISHAHLLLYIGGTIAVTVLILISMVFITINYNIERKKHK